MALALALASAYATLCAHVPPCAALYALVSPSLIAALLVAHVLPSFLALLHAPVLWLGLWFLPLRFYATNRLRRTPSTLVCNQP